jgi:site-specific DNA-methyltransferase (adenine-specific)
MLKLNKIYLGDCLDLMRKIDNKSIDMILCDLPYGTTSCKWDTVIPFEPLWEQYNRIIKDNGAIVLTASQPFTSALVMSNLKMFKYCWVWNKRFPGNFTLAKYQPMKIHEDICVFSKDTALYNPQMIQRDKPIRNGANKCTSESAKFSSNSRQEGFKKVYTEKYPESIVCISNRSEKRGLHPTQKPVPLFEYLIKTYTNKGDLVLDNCIGSGTTAIACLNTERKFIGIEKEKKYIDIAISRVADWRKLNE